MKRLFDLVVILATSFVWIPLLGILAALVLLLLGRPIIFRQQRPGLNGKPFQLLKFRTMSDERDAAGKLLPDRQRLSRFGRWLRASSLDELPELFNVLRGEMSLVGPRPLLMQYLPLYSPQQARRHEVLPGMTGWAQVNGRNCLSWEEKFELDLWYVNNRSFLLDLRILAKTLVVIVSRRGVNASDMDTAPEFKGSEPASASHHND